MYTIVWKYKVSSENLLQFERVYGKDGIWWKYFSKDSNYIGSFLYKNELFQKQVSNDEYILLDQWTSMESYDDFKLTHKEEYEHLSSSFEKLYEAEVCVGAFRSPI